MKKSEFPILLYWLLIGLLTLYGCENTAQVMGNQLSKESSPYLLQHANNPVDWHAWNEATLQKAKELDKPILISIGYAACHWCHVMEDESFEDTAVARIMNEHFINIKVDREERPDIDQVYMTACQLAQGGGCGWPLNAIALPDGRPFWATTYMPKENWVKSLNYFIDLLINDRPRVLEAANRLEQGINDNQILPPPDKSDLYPEQIALWTERMMQGLDIKGGGRKGSPKFPLPGMFEYLQKAAFLSNQPDQLEAVDNTLLALAKGGIYDHLEGGFARYSTDAEWHIPHFEKMLYDNAQLISLYSQAYRRTQNPIYADRAKATIQFVQNNWKDEAGGYYSSYDADSKNDLGEKEEGAFYVWRLSEVEEILGESESTKAYCELYNITSRGNWEKGHNVLRIVKDNSDVVSKYDLDVTDFEAFVQSANAKLKEVRQQRPPPGLDNKVLCNWNALLLTGFVEAYKSFGDESYKQSALDLADFLTSKMIQSDGSILRSMVDGKTRIPGLLDDYSMLALGLLDLYEITFDKQWFDKAVGLEEYIERYFWNDEEGEYSFGSSQMERLPLKTKDYSDNVIPGAFSTMANLEFRLGLYKGDNERLAKSKTLLRRVGRLADQTSNPGFYYGWLNLYLDTMNPPFEVAILGEDYAAQAGAIQRQYLPNAIYLGGVNEGGFDLLKNKLIDGQTTIYVCKNKVCQLPTQDFTVALAQIGQKNRE